MSISCYVSAGDFNHNAHFESDEVAFEGAQLSRLQNIKDNWGRSGYEDATGGDIAIFKDVIVKHYSSTLNLGGKMIPGFQVSDEVISHVAQEFKNNKNTHLRKKYRMLLSAGMSIELERKIIQEFSIRTNFIEATMARLAKPPINVISLM